MFINIDVEQTLTQNICPFIYICIHVQQSGLPFFLGRIVARATTNYFAPRCKNGEVATRRFFIVTSHP
jgi:hypothetical protein